MRQTCAVTPTLATLISAMAGITTSCPFKLIHTRTIKTLPYLRRLSSSESKVFGFPFCNPNFLRVDCSTASMSVSLGSSVMARYGGGSRSNGNSRRSRSDSDEDQALDMSSLRYRLLILMRLCVFLKMFVEFDA